MQCCPFANYNCTTTKYKLYRFGLYLAFQGGNLGQGWGAIKHRFFRWRKLQTMLLKWFGSKNSSILQSFIEQSEAKKNVLVSLSEIRENFQKPYFRNIQVTQFFLGFHSVLFLGDFTLFRTRHNSFSSVIYVSKFGQVTKNYDSEKQSRNITIFYIEIFLRKFFSSVNM